MPSALHFCVIWTSVSQKRTCKQILIPGWWLEHHVFPYLGKFIIPSDVHIFQRGGSTTDQDWFEGVLREISQETFIFDGRKLVSCFPPTNEGSLMDQRLRLQSWVPRSSTHGLHGAGELIRTAQEKLTARHGQFPMCLLCLWKQCTSKKWWLIIIFHNMQIWS